MSNWETPPLECSQHHMHAFGVHANGVDRIILSTPVENHLNMVVHHESVRHNIKLSCLTCAKLGRWSFSVFKKLFLQGQAKHGGYKYQSDRSEHQSKILKVVE